MDIKLEEKRRFQRLEVKSPLRFQSRGESGFANAVTSNIGLGGLGFTSDSFIVPGTVLDLEIKLLSNALSPVGRIAWSQPLPHSSRYQIGLEFVEVSPNQRDYLSEYLDMRMDKL